MMRASRPLCSKTVTLSGHYYGERSAVTQLMWDVRKEENALRNPAHSALRLATRLVERRPSDSFQEIVLPFSSDELLRAQYVSPFGHVRVGRLLEDLDAFAGTCAFLHVDDEDPETRLPSLVTAGMQNMRLTKPHIDPNVDLVIKGGVIATGRSSMELLIEAEQLGDTVLRTFFSFVARDPEANAAHPINPLVTETARDKALEAEAQANKRERVLAASQDLRKQVPRGEELAMVHQFFVDAHLRDKCPEEFSWMEDTRHNALLFMSVQSSNLNASVFGGYLMRSSFELAFGTAHLFIGGTHPRFHAVGDVSFRAPVPLGSLLDLRSEITYTEDHLVQVMVQAFVRDPVAKTNVMTNEFHFTFASEEPAPKVRPRSYNQAMRYISGKRSLSRQKV